MLSEHPIPAALLANLRAFTTRYARYWLPAFSLVVLLLSVCAQEGHAQSVSWTQTDLSNPPVPGTYSYHAGTPPTFTIQGSGGGFDNVPPNCCYVYATANGNTEMQARLVSQSSGSSTAYSGLLMTNFPTYSGLTGASIGVFAGGGLSFYYCTPGSGWNKVDVSGVSAPVYVRLVRSPNAIAGYYSADGQNWTLAGTLGVTNIMPPLYYTGFMVDNKDAGSSLNTAVFDHVTYAVAEPQPSSNMALWLRSDVGVTSSSGSVSSWADQSGNGMDATQSNGSLQPQVVSGAINSGVLPTISFDGATQYLSTASGFANLTQGASIFVVTQPQSGSATGNFCSFGNASNSDAVFVQAVGANASMSAYNGSTASSVITSTSPLSTSQYQLVENIYQPGATAGTGTIWVNGVQQTQSTSLVPSLNNVTRTINNIGVDGGLSHYFNGNIAEILVFSTPLTQAQRKSIEAYVLSKYAVGNQPTLDPPTMSPPAGIVMPSQTISMSQDVGAIMYYTTNGATPTTSSQQYGNPFALSNSATVKALAASPFYNNSPVTSNYYQVDMSTLPVPRTGLALWLRSDLNVTTGSGDQVSGWGDLSDSGNDASQASSPAQPTLVANAVNGLPAINFNGSSQFMQLGAISEDFGSGSTIFLATKPITLSDSARFCDFENCTAGTNLYMSEASNSGVDYAMFNGTVNISVNANNALTADGFVVLDATLAGWPSSAAMYVDGSPASYSVSPNNYIGQASAGGSFYNGQIAEIILYNRTLTVSEHAAVEGYLFSRYSVSSVAASAPVISVASGSLNGPTQVAVSAPSEATIYYTTDGTTPTTGSAVYTGPINILFSQTLKAIAVISGTPSTVSSATYTLDATEWPAPNASDPTLLKMNLQLPATSIP